MAHDLERFRAFVRGRVRDPHLADEVLQGAFARAARAIDKLQNDERLDAWFYRILRNRIADLRTAQVNSEVLHEDPVTPVNDEHHMCQCFHQFVERFPQEHAEALRRVDLDSASSETVAADLGITANALNVRRHRGRQQLRTLLTAACGMCAGGGCRDCQCNRV